MQKEPKNTRFQIKITSNLIPQKKVNTWNIKDQEDISNHNSISSFKHNPNFTDINLNNFKQENFLKDNFPYFTENYLKITSTNKIQNAKTPKDLLNEIEADIKVESLNLRKNCDWQKLEKFLKFFHRNFEEIGFYFFTKKIIKCFKFILDFCENNFLNKISECEPNLNNQFIHFLANAEKNKYFAYVLEKEFRLFTWSQIREKIKLLQEKKDEFVNYLLKQKKKNKNKKTFERNMRNKEIKIDNANSTMENSDFNYGIASRKYCKNFSEKFDNDKFEK